MVPDADSESKPTRTRVDEDRELQEAIMRPPEEGEPADLAAEQVGGPVQVFFCEQRERPATVVRGPSRRQHSFELNYFNISILGSLAAVFHTYIVTDMCSLPEPMSDVMYVDLTPSLQNFTKRASLST